MSSSKCEAYSCEKEPVDTIVVTGPTLKNKEAEVTGTYTIAVCPVHLRHLYNGHPILLPFYPVYA